MSRLQKKKPVSEKKKQRAASESKTDLSASSSGSSSSKSTIGAGAIKAKSEKNLVDSAGEPNIFQRAMVFFREVKVELKKVTWPTRKQTTGTTIVVIIFVFVIAAFLGLFDVGLSKLVQVVLT